MSRLCSGRRRHSAPLLLVLIAGMLAGCGNSKSDAGGLAAADPNAGKRSQEMRNFMKNQEPQAKKPRPMRNHP
ncbi:MAG: hypothetical protein P4L84_17635 [Isosphaeraceae bacterium]|nr:hypothetical protein [Isosphaeraceae bacterium]